MTGTAREKETAPRPFRPSSRSSSTQPKSNQSLLGSTLREIRGWKPPFVTPSRSSHDLRSPGVRRGMSQFPPLFPACQLIHPEYKTSGVQLATNVASRHPAPTGRRSYSQDSATPAANMKASSRTKSSKKGSTHADVIDRLDFTGVGPSASIMIFCSAFLCAFSLTKIILSSVPP